MRSNLIISTLFLIACFSGCENKKLQYFEYSEIQSLVLDSAIGNPKVWNRDTTISNYKPILNIDIADSLDLYKLRVKEDLLKPRWLDTTNLFVREEFLNLIESNEIITLKNPDEDVSNLKIDNYVLNFTKEIQAEYFSNDTIGHLTFYPLINNRSLINAIQVCNFHKFGDWGFCKVFFLKKTKGKWNIVGSNMLWIS